MKKTSQNMQANTPQLKTVYKREPQKIMNRCSSIPLLSPPLHLIVTSSSVEY